MNKKMYKQVLTPIPEKYLKMMNDFREWIYTNYPDRKIKGNIVIGVSKYSDYFDDMDLFMEVDGIRFSADEINYYKEVPLTLEERQELAQAEIDRIKKEYDL